VTLFPCGFVVYLTAAFVFFLLFSRGAGIVIKLVEPTIEEIWRCVSASGIQGRAHDRQSGKEVPSN